MNGSVQQAGVAPTKSRSRQLRLHRLQRPLVARDRAKIASGRFIQPVDQSRQPPAIDAATAPAGKPKNLLVVEHSVS